MRSYWDGCPASCCGLTWSVPLPAGLSGPLVHILPVFFPVYVSQTPACSAFPNREISVLPYLLGSFIPECYL